MDAIANQRYQSIKQQLDQLHYSQPFNIESSALVERLLTDLLKTTEAYQKVKNELAIVNNENKLNQQALLPLQKENERLSKESNVLHFDIIKAKEELEQLDLKWKSAMRQITNECQDLRFLVDQKDIKIKKQDIDLTKMKSKYEKVMSKMYMSEQDEVIEGLAPNINERGEMNILMQGKHQDFQMSSPLKRYNQDISELVNDESHYPLGNNHLNQTMNKDYDNKKWADELAKADERSQNFMQKLEQANKKRHDIENKLETLEKQLTVREEEIRRLHNLYEGGQNLEKLNVRFVHETNERTIAKLQNQIDFLNKENHRLAQQIDFLRGGKPINDEIDNLRQQVNDLEFENDTLKRDIKEYVKLLKDFQEKEQEFMRLDQVKSEGELIAQRDLERKLQEVQSDHDKLKQEYERLQSVKGAYTADKKVFIDRINELEQQLIRKDSDKQDLQNKFNLQEQSSVQYRNEINFLNGKCSTLKRDLEYQERYIEKYKDENTKLGAENEYLKQKIDAIDRDQALLRKQVNGLQEDNDRINRLYQVVEKDAFSSQAYKRLPLDIKIGGQENNPKIDPYMELNSARSHASQQNNSIKQVQSQQQTPKHHHHSQSQFTNNAGGVQNKWKVVDDDYGSIHGSAHKHNQSHIISIDENQVTMKRLQ
ncbi:centrosomal protein of 135 kda [Stylonychia lemnae]|uniref:Centrosomal protein of 135 kDa n=1 Tax=Stylonychia lemnae TaxID=5949 RepID=A0A078A6Y8_STYLE|nr:centrosomal protein of 135 kda [Stylonychia lemnae]|eukprot:CDW76514.1 centrosomal protein of 135 kda [Stylonychia lemnae]